MNGGAHSNGAAAVTGSFARRLWTYLNERFPPVHHGALIVALAASGVGFSAIVRSSYTSPAFDEAIVAPSLWAFIVASGVLFCVFFQLRVADEHKDYEDDSQFRPERPVPRGLISLKELRAVAVLGAVVQLVLAVSLDISLVIVLFAVWAWAGLMSVEFFAPRWLKARPIIYMVSHMAIMPLINLFATACDWLPHGGLGGWRGFPITSLTAYLGLSFFNGAVMEIARKCWATDAEREGVETYSKLWGPNRAGVVVAILATVSFGFCVAANWLSGVHIGHMVVLFAPWAFVVVSARGYAREASQVTSKRLELSAGIFVLCAYLLVGVTPLGARLWL